MSDWKLVPVEPTQAMFDMFADASDESGDDFVIAYAAMLEAAPQPDTVEPACSLCGGKGYMRNALLGNLPCNHPPAKPDTGTASAETRAWVEAVVADTRKNNKFFDDPEGRARDESFTQALNLVEAKLDYFRQPKSTPPDTVAVGRKLAAHMNRAILETEIKSLLDQKKLDGTDTDVGTKCAQPDTVAVDERMTARDWRNDAFEKSARIAEQYGYYEVAVDVRALLDREK